MSFLPSLFLGFWFPARGASCQFHCTGFPLHSAFTTWAFTKLGFGCTWPPPCGDQAKVVSARLHPSHGIRYVGGVCNFLGSVSPQQKCEMADQCYSSVTAQFYSQAKEGTPSRLTEGGLTPKERPQSILASPFMQLFPPRLDCMQIGLAKKEVCLFHLKFSLQSVDFLFFHFHGLFPFFVFWPPQFWTTFSCSNYLTVPKTQKWKCYLLSHVRLCVIPWSVHGILQARILEWVAIPFFRGSSRPRD